MCRAASLLLRGGAILFRARGAVKPPCETTGIATKGLSHYGNVEGGGRLRARCARAVGLPRVFSHLSSAPQRHKNRSGHFVGRAFLLRMRLEGGRATWRSASTFPIGHRGRARPCRVLIGCLEGELSADWLRGGVSRPEGGAGGSDGGSGGAVRAAGGCAALRGYGGDPGGEPCRIGEGSEIPGAR